MSISPIEYTHHQIIKAQLSDDEDHENQRRYSLTHKVSLANSDDDNSNTDQKLSKKHTLNLNEDQLPPQQESFVLKLVQNIYFQIFITCLTVITLLLYDLKTILLNKEQDFGVGVANLIFFVFFMLQILMNVTTEGYLWSFYFYLDIVSTLTLLLDVDFITDMLFNQGGSNFQLSSLVAKSKASRAAARAVRVVKIFRLARVAKLYKSTQRAREIKQSNRPQLDNNSFLQALNNKKANPNELTFTRMEESQRKPNSELEVESKLIRYDNQMDGIKEEESSQIEENKSEVNIKLTSSFDGRITQGEQLKTTMASEEEAGVQVARKRESNISRILSDDTIKRIIVIILLIMISIPVMDINNYLNISTQWDFLVAFTAKMLYNPTINATQIASLIYNNLNQIPALDIDAELLCFDTPFNQISACSVSDFSKFRNNDIGYFVQTINVSEVLGLRNDLTLKANFTVGHSVDSIVLFLNYHKYNSKDACFSIATTTFICLTIIYLLAEFSNSVSELIITPIESMLMMIQWKECREEGVEKQGEEYETQMVQNAILKIKGLMGTIFGHIGNELVNAKMINNLAINSNLQESRTRGLFIFTHLTIANLPEITEILAQETFKLLNEVALIAQKAAFRYGGECVKMHNSGFLIAFKIPHKQLIKMGLYEEMDVSSIGKRYQERVRTYLRVLCDFSFYTVLKIHARMAKEPKISQLRKNQRFLNHFKRNIYNFQLNFISNMGWADQGIAGSTYKMDTILLGTPLMHLSNIAKMKTGLHNRFIIAESLYTNLSPQLRSYCRCLQKVVFPQNPKPEAIYAVDLDISNVSGSRKGDEKQLKNNKQKKGGKQKSVYDVLKEKRRSNMHFAHKQLANYDPNAFIANKKELREILQKPLFLKKAFNKYNRAFQMYTKGEWIKALQLLEDQKLAEDTLTLRLLAYIRASNCKPPEDWKGSRPLAQLI